MTPRPRARPRKAKSTIRAKLQRPQCFYCAAELFRYDDIDGERRECRGCSGTREAATIAALNGAALLTEERHAAVVRVASAIGELTLLRVRHREGVLSPKGYDRLVLLEKAVPVPDEPPAPTADAEGGA